MSLEELLGDRIIQRVTPNSSLARKSLKLAERDLKSAKTMLDRGNYDWCLAIAYNSMLQAGRALMFLKGFRPYSQYKHKAVIQFVHEAFGVDIGDRLVYVFDKIRKKRHRVVYEEPEIVSKNEARQAIKWAEEFVSKVKKIISGL